MKKKFDLNDYFVPVQGSASGALKTSAAASIWLSYDLFFHGENTSPSSQSRAWRIISASIELFKKKHVPQSDYIETWLTQRGTKAIKLLPSLAEACNIAGQSEVEKIIKQALDD